MNIAAPDENRETALSRKHKPDEANQQLQESGVQFQAVLQDLFTQAPALIGLLQGREHRWTYVNDELVRLTGGQDPAKLLGRTLRETFPAIEDTFLALLEDVYESGRPYAGREVKITLNRGTSGETGEGH